MSSSDIKAQDVEARQVLQALQIEIDASLTFADSLPPLKFSKPNDKRIPLTRKEFREIRRNSSQQKGLVLDDSYFPGARFISAARVFETIIKPDSASRNFFRYNKPFYMIFQPILYNNSQNAIIDMDLFGRHGFTYILEKTNKTWVIKKVVARWYASG
jgi:hypothetical protein